MKLSPSRLLVAGIVAGAAALPLAQAAHAGPSEPDVPTRIQVPEGNKLFLVAHAVGVQIYPCNATATGFEWGPSTPRADLYDDGGKPIGDHYGGPSWRAKDGSTVVARRKDGVTVDPTAVAWLLLERTSSSAGPDGSRLFPTTFIQRLATAGGIPPAAAECNAETVGDTVEVPYTADYYFWKSKA